MKTQEELIEAAEKRLESLIDQMGTRMDQVEADSGYAANLSRCTFIREAAISIYVAGMSSPPEGVTYVGNAPGVTFSPRTCWAAAKALWDAKPEDC